MPSDPNCTQCQEWEICPFHSRAAGESMPETARSPDVNTSPRRTAAINPTWRLLGPDDPEVSTDLIYVTPAGGLVSVPVDLDEHFEALERELFGVLH